jgi:tetratricopeptide (TPR) repeat protein
MEDYADNDGAPKSLKDVSSTIYYAILSKEKERRSEETLKRYRKEFGLKIYRKELDFSTPKSSDAIFEETKKLHEDRKYADATRNYLDLRYRFPKFKSHPDICMALAQIYIEQNQYYKAIQEYKRFMRLYPDNKDKYKAQFMIAFVYSENLKDKDKAVFAYQSVLDNYPACDLVESAKFMIDHLKSGKDDFAFLNDSTGVADTSAAAAGAPKPAVGTTAEPKKGEAPKAPAKTATKKAETPKPAAKPAAAKPAAAKKAGDVKKK